MKISVSKEELLSLTCRQLSNFFCLDDREAALMREVSASVLDKVEYCFSKTSNKYYSKDGETYFNPFQSAQYTIYLYFFSRAVFLKGDRQLADKIYYLNKVMNSCDLYYEVELPDYFKLDHPVGSVMGRAKYGEGFSFGQCSTVGNNKGIYPVLGNNVRMCANSSIIGNCHVGDNVIIAANSGIKDCDVPSDTIVFGQYPDNVFKKIKK